MLLENKPRKCSSKINLDNNPLDNNPLNIKSPRVPPMMFPEQLHDNTLTTAHTENTHHCMTAHPSLQPRVPPMMFPEQLHEKVANQILKQKEMEDSWKQWDYCDFDGKEMY
jgi:hypothetical protein